MVNVDDRLLERLGAADIKSGVPYGNLASTLSLLPAAVIGEFLADHREHFKGLLLDLGCGNQPYKDWYGPLVSGIITVDAAPVDAAQVRAQSHQLPLRSDSFDVVLLTNVLEHVDDAEGSMKEIARILRPGGHAVVVVPFMYPVHESPYDHVRFTHLGLRKVAERYGLNVLTIETQGGVPAWLGHMSLMFGLQLVAQLAPSLPHRHWFRRVVAAPQQLAIRRGLHREFTRGSRWISLGYMTVLEKPLVR